jgi:hypothetical protein
MAKNGAHTPQQAAANAGAKGLGRLRQLFSRKKNTPDTPNVAAGAAAAQMGAAGAMAGANTMKRGALTNAAVGADRAVGRAHGAISRVNSFVYYGGFLAGGLAFMGRLPVVGRAFTAASKVAGSPREYMDNTTVRQAFRAPSTLLGAVRKTAESKALAGAARDGLVGADGKLVLDGLSGGKAFAARVANGLSGAEKKVGTAETSLVALLKKGAEKIFTPLGDAAGKVGSEQRIKLAEKVAGTAGKQHGKAMTALEEVLSQSKGNKSLSGVQEALGKAKEMLGDGTKRMGKDDMGAFQEVLGSAREGLSGLTKGAVDKKTLTGLQKGLKQVEGASGAFNQRSGMADKIRDLPNTIKGAPNALANANLTNVALKGAVVTGTALQVTNTTRGIAEKIHGLKQMYCDMTGETKISTRKLLTSKDVPAIVKEARGQILKEFGPRVVLNFANTIATYGFMKNSSKATMLVSGGLMALSQLHSAKVQGYALLPMYEALNQAPEIQDVQYAAFIAAASPDAAKAGGVESALVQALAVDYAKEGARPADILNEIENGRFDERALEKAQANRTAMEGMGGHKLAGPDGANREVVGTHTQRLQNEMAQRGMNPQARG